MRRAVVLFFGLVLAVLAFSPSAVTAKRVALVIGIDAYDNLPKLQKAVNDEKAVAEALTTLGFEVVTGENLSRREMNAKLAELDAKIAPGDTVFFYFAGHGVALGAENYLLPSDLPKPKDGEENLVRDEGHAVDAIVRRVQGKGAAVSFFVLDACRDNPIAAAGARSIGGTRGLTRMDAPNGVFLLYSAGVGQTALDRLSDSDPDPNSVFTRKLVPLLKTPGLTQIALAKRVQLQVDELAATVRHPQQPAFYDQIIGEVQLSPATATAALAPSVTPTPTAPTETEAPVPEPETQVAVVTPPPAPALAQELPGKGSPLRGKLLDAARPAFAAETGGPVEFSVRRLAVFGDWAFGDVSLQRPGGQPIDWMATKFAQDLRQDMFNPGYAYFLLKKTGGGWSVAEISVGPTDVAWDSWRQKYKIPEALFRP
jgi:Caspase domain